MLELKVIGKNVGIEVSKNDLLEFKRVLAFLINKDFGNLIASYHAQKVNLTKIYHMMKITAISKAKELKIINNENFKVIEFISSRSNDETVCNDTVNYIFKLLKKFDVNNSFFEIFRICKRKKYDLVIRKSQGIIKLIRERSVLFSRLVNKIESIGEYFNEFDEAQKKHIDVKQKIFHNNIYSGYLSIELKTDIDSLCFLTLKSYNKIIFNIKKKLSKIKKKTKKLSTLDNQIVKNYIISVSKDINSKAMETIVEVTSTYKNLKYAESIQKVFRKTKKNNHFLQI